MPESSFIEVHTYGMQTHPTKKNKVHMKRVLNVAHIVSVEEHFYTDRNKDLKTVPACAIKMFGQEPIGVKESVDEVAELLQAAGHSIEAVA